LARLYQNDSKVNSIDKVT